MFFHWKLFFRALRLSLFGQPFRLRRWAYVLFFTALFLLFLVFVAVGRALDHLFFPGFKRQPVKAPVFIVAPPRSGTTLVQKLLSLDEQRFVHLKMYQTIFPVVTYQRLIGALGRLDRAVGRPLGRLLGWCETKWFGGWDNTHKMRLDQPEEDDALFLYAFQSEAVYLLFPFVKALREAGFNDALPPEKRRRLMRHYRSCLQRQLHANGPGRTLLSKATQSSGTVESLLEEFPDARFITIIRHPYRSVASRLSMFSSVWRAHSPDLPHDGEAVRENAQLAVDWFKHLFRFRTRVDPARYHCLDFRDLVKDPLAAVEQIYEKFGWEMDEALRARLAEAAKHGDEFKSKHTYSLEEFGLSQEWVQQELGEVLDFYRLER